MSESSASSPSSADSFDNAFCPCGTFDVAGTGSPVLGSPVNPKEERKAHAVVPSIERPLKYSTKHCKLLVRDVTDPANPKRIFVNSFEPHEIDNELFKGQLIFKARTHPVDARMVHYFEQYPKLQFEIQLQGKFKRRNRGVMYVGGELRAHTSPSFFRRGLVAVLLRILHSFNKKLQYSLGEPSPAHPQPNVEWFQQLADKQAPPEARTAGVEYDPEKVVGPSDAPHPSPGFLSFPLAPGMDRLIVTPPGHPPPPLGVDMWTQDYPGCADKKTADPAWSFDPENTYSMSFFSQNADVSRWKIVNLPGLGELNLRDYWGTSPMRVVVYELKPDTLPDGDGVVSDDADTPHDHKHRNYILALEISNPILFDE